jgi:hypothetical protein
MFGSTALEVAVGVIFVYLLFSLVCSVSNEWIASILNQRGKNLLEGTKNLLNDPTFTGLAQQVYGHGLIDGLMQGASDPNKANRLPSYISSSNFALALVDVLTSRGAPKSWKDLLETKQKEVDQAQQKSQADPGNVQLAKAAAQTRASHDEAVKSVSDAETKHQVAQEAAAEVNGLKDLENIARASKALEEALAAGRELAAKYRDPLRHVENAVVSLPAGHTRESLLVLVAKTKREVTLASEKVASVEHQIAKLQENVQAWFESAMDRVTGWYKRWQQVVSLVIACILVAVANADTIMLAKRLTRDNALRASVVAAVDREVQNSATDLTANEATRRALFSEAENLTLPLGWVTPQTVGGSDPETQDQVPENATGWTIKILGLSISALAVSLGAPFWFDVLSKIANIRAAGIPPQRARTRAGTK